MYQQLKTNTIFFEVLAGLFQSNGFLAHIKDISAVVRQDKTAKFALQVISVRFLLCLRSLQQLYAKNLSYPFYFNRQFFYHMFKMQQSDLIGVPSLDPKKMTTEEREEYERDWLGYYRRHSKARTEAFKRMIKRKSQAQRLQRERKIREMDEMKREKERQQEIGYQLKRLASKVYKYFSSEQEQTQQPSKEQGEKQLHITKQNRNLDEEEQHLLKKEQ